MISVVNGYVCTSSCEAASARAGKDPNAPPGTLPGQSGKTNHKTDKTSGLDGQPATVLGRRAEGYRHRQRGDARRRHNAAAISPC